MQLFELVADVPRYPEFLPWCHAGRIRRREEPNVQIAELARAIGISPADLFAIEEGRREMGPAMQRKAVAYLQDRAP